MQNENKKKIIIGASISGALILVIVLGLFAYSGGALFGDLSKGLKSKGGVSVEKTVLKKELSVLEKIEKLKGTVLNSDEAKKTGLSPMDQKYTLDVYAEPTGGAYDTSKYITLKYQFVDKNDLVVNPSRFSPEVTIMYAIPEVSNMWMVYSPPFMVSKPQNHVVYYAQYNGNIQSPIEVEVYEINDMKAPMIEAATYDPESEYLTLEFDEFMDISNQYAGYELMSFFSFNNSTTIQPNPNSNVYWYNVMSKEKTNIMIPLSNFEEGGELTYSGELLKDGAGNLLANITIPVVKKEIYYPVVEVEQTPGVYDLPIGITYKVTFVDDEGNLVGPDVYTAPVSIGRRIIPIEQHHPDRFPYKYSGNHYIFDDSAVMYFAKDANTGVLSEYKAGLYYNSDGILPNPTVGDFINEVDSSINVLEELGDSIGLFYPSNITDLELLFTFEDQFYNNIEDLEDTVDDYAEVLMNANNIQQGAIMDKMQDYEDALGDTLYFLKGSIGNEEMMPYYFDFEDDLMDMFDDIMDQIDDYFGGVNNEFQNLIEEMDDVNDDLEDIHDMVVSSGQIATSDQLVGFYETIHNVLDDFSDIVDDYSDAISQMNEEEYGIFIDKLIIMQERIMSILDAIVDNLIPELIPANASLNQQLMNHWTDIITQLVEILPVYESDGMEKLMSMKGSGDNLNAKQEEVVKQEVKR